MSEFDGVEHDLFGHLFHLAFDHQDVVDRSAHHDVQIGVGVLRERRIDHELPVDPRHAHLGNRAAERNVRNGQRSRRGQPSQRIGHDIFIGGNQVDGNEYFRMEIRREQRPQRAVDQTRYENFVIRRTAFPFQEPAGETTAGCVFFLVFNRQRHKIAVVLSLFGCRHRSEQHGVALFDNNRTVGLFC